MKWVDGRNEEMEPCSYTIESLRFHISSWRGEVDVKRCREAGGEAEACARAQTWSQNVSLQLQVRGTLHFDFKATRMILQITRKAGCALSNHCSEMQNQLRDPLTW
jgi:hypothetical protein